MLGENHGFPSSAVLTDVGFGFFLETSCGRKSNYGSHPVRPGVVLLTKKLQLEWGVVAGQGIWASSVNGGRMKKPGRVQGCACRVADTHPLDGVVAGSDAVAD